MPEQQSHRDAEFQVSWPTKEIMIITLDRRARLNALTESSLQWLLETFADLRHDMVCRGVVITGAGRGFCSGLDILENDDILNGGHITPDELLATAVRWSSILPAMRAIPQLVVAAVNGPAVGGGFLLALGADLRVASSNAYFADGFITIGLSGCELGMSWILPRMIGMSRASSLMMTGRKMHAAEALECGLVEAVVEPEMLLPSAIEVVETAIQHSRFGILMTKEIMWASQETACLSQAIAIEARTQTLAILTAQARGGTQKLRTT